MMFRTGRTVDELRKMASQLLALADAEEARTGRNRGDREGETASKPRYSDEALADFARQISGLRTEREKHFPAKFFGEIAWDMLLDLFACEVGGRPVSVTDATVAARASSATGVKYVQSLVEAGLVERRPSATDQRVTHLRLTPKGLSAMRRTLAFEVKRFWKRPLIEEIRRSEEDALIERVRQKDPEFAEKMLAARSSAE